MRIIGTCMLANESDIVEAFVRHNLGLLDALVLLDHGSVDSTPEILRNLVDEALPIVVLRDNDRAYRQDVRQTYLARRYLEELEADFCFPIDADEFIKVESRARLEETLAALPPGACAAVPIQNYVGSGAAPDDPNPVRRLTRRQKQERSPTHKVVVPREFARSPDLHISMGNHAAVRVRDQRAEPLQHARTRDVALAHYPVRSPEQIARKALLGWPAHRLAVPGAAAGQGFISHWKGIYAGLASGQIAVDEVLMQRAVGFYVGGSQEPLAPEDFMEDPLPVAYELRYAAQATPSPMSVLAAWVDRLVTDIKAGTVGGR